MKMAGIATAIAALVLLVWTFRGSVPGWRNVHSRVIGGLVLLYAVYLATLSGTVTQFVVPGVGAIGGGAAAGAGIGLLTYLVIGTVGVATGGTGWAVGAVAMALIGGGFGAAGGAVGGAGFRTVSYPLVSPWFWLPLMGLSIYIFIGSSKPRGCTARTEKPKSIDHQRPGQITDE